MNPSLMINLARTGIDDLRRAAAAARPRLDVQSIASQACFGSAWKADTPCWHDRPCSTARSHRGAGLVALVFNSR